MNRDLTVGRPRDVLWRFCLPLFASVIFQQLYNLADSWVAGRFIGEAALAAVGNSYEITLIYIAFAFGCNIGCSVITARYFGAKDYTNMKSAVSTSILSSGVICLMLMLAGLFFSSDMLSLIRTPQELFTDSKVYLDIYIRGLPFVFFYNLATGIFSAMGDSRTPFYFLAVSSMVNIAADILFVTVFHMGVAGVAWATFLCQGASCLLSLWIVFRRLRSMKCAVRPALFSGALFRQFISIAAPSILQQSFISFGNIVIQGVINGFGAGVVAGYSAGVKLNNLVITSLTTLGNGISNFASQNIGAKRYSRLQEGFQEGLRLVWMISVPMSVLYFLFPGTLLRLFLNDPSADALRSGVLFLRILVPFYCIVSAKLVSDGILRGGAYMKKFMTGTFTDLILRVVLAILFSKTALGYVGIWCAWPIGWIISTLISLWFYKHLHFPASEEN